MDEPIFRVYLRERTPVEVYPQDTPGRWVAEEAWPSKRITPSVLYLDRDGLTNDPGVPVVRDYVASRIVGLKHGEIDGFFFPMDFPQEQTTEDAKSLTFDSAPLNEPVDFVGQPVLRAHISADVSIAMLTVRLDEVTEDGKSSQVASGFLNLTHRESDERPAPLEPGRSYEVEVQLAFTSQRLRRGSKIRVAISEGCWPLIWPSPRIATLSIKTAMSALTLPIRPPKDREPGMTLCVESYIGEVGGSEGVKLEQQVLVTTTGCEILSKFPLDAGLLA
jgi:predicted acyl esterase